MKKENLKNAIRLSGIKQAHIAELMGVSNNTVSRWVNGIFDPDDEKKMQLAKLLNTTVSYLMGETNDPMPVAKIDGGRKLDGSWNIKNETSNAEKSGADVHASQEAPKPNATLRGGSIKEIPLLSMAMAASCGAGNGLYGVDLDSTEVIYIDSSALGYVDSEHQPFGVYTEGDSMVGADIGEDTIAVINPAVEVFSGDAALVEWNSNWFIKWVVYMPNGSVELRSANPNFDPIKIDKEYAEQSDWFRIIGKVVATIKRGKPKRAF